MVFTKTNNFTLILTWTLHASVIHGQIFSTPCAVGGTECDAFPNSVCDTANSLVCVCPGALGYIANGNRTRCDYSYGALTSPAGGTVSTTATITGGVATYACNPGFILNGVNTRTCVLNSGWSNTAPTCLTGKLNDDCSVKTDLCANIANGNCLVGSCTCNAGYQDDGTTKNCTDINECVSDPCLNDAACVNGLAKYTCQCAVGWTGTNCETDINECASVPCRNGATCTHGLDAYQCTCAPGYSGVNCDTDINECTSNPCVNGATCVDAINGFNCVCVSGYTGAQCQTDINECATVTCENGATCDDLINAYRCRCVTGFTGNLCQTNINDCIGIVCNNGGTCVDQVNNYACNCVSGYSGSHCNTNINDCISITCANNGTCIDKINSFNCACAPGWTGTLARRMLTNVTAMPAQTMPPALMYLVGTRASVRMDTLDRFVKRK
ncbi:hypothetical protein DPMN_051686 [Dreissena polymorpha]|uniref:Uncharacterized protein n=1 Tax=Dreissena polymorpha TaxID=45954 RepID=A0A9D4CIA6_DREPO|nr:hypothetical protein DPMN_051686 [Dreissena polymorpha]